MTRAMVVLTGGTMIEPRAELRDVDTGEVILSGLSVEDAQLRADRVNEIAERHARQDEVVEARQRSFEEHMLEPTPPGQYRANND